MDDEALTAIKALTPKQLERVNKRPSLRTYLLRLAVLILLVLLVNYGPIRREFSWKYVWFVAFTELWFWSWIDLGSGLLHIAFDNPRLLTHPITAIAQLNYSFLDV